MSEIGKFIAFQAAVKLLKERGNGELIREVYQQCIAQKGKPASEMKNYVKRIYDQFTDDEITAKISELVYPHNIEWKGEVEIVYQTVEDLHKSIPSCDGDWFFTGNYPTPGIYGSKQRIYKLLRKSRGAQLLGFNCWGAEISAPAFINA
ncbi:MAG: hypothetical protein ACLUKN_02435 [Bacilli bacterium]